MQEFSTATITQTLQATPLTLRALLHDLPPALYTKRLAPGEWSINEVVGHLIAADRFAFADRIALMLAEDHPTIPAVDVDEIAQTRRDHERDLFELLDELAEARQQQMALVASLTQEQLARTGHYGNYGDFRVADFVYEWAYHDYAHLQQILEILKTEIWPHFSATMQRALSG